MRTVRLLLVGLRTHVTQLSRSPLEIVSALVLPLVYATLAVYLFRGTGRPGLDATVGAGLMGTWSTVLFAAGTAIQTQRWLGTLELLVVSPVRLPLLMLPVTLASAVVGSYAMAAALLWGALLGVPAHMQHPLLFWLSVPVTTLTLGLLGLLLAAAFVLLRNANAVINPLDTPVWLLSGMLLPLSVLPGWTHPLSYVLTTTWSARALHAAIDGGPVWPSLGLAVALGVLYALAGVRVLSVVERRARAAGSLALA